MNHDDPLWGAEHFMKEYYTFHSGQENAGPLNLLRSRASKSFTDDPIRKARSDQYEKDYREVKRRLLDEEGLPLV